MATSASGDRALAEAADDAFASCFEIPGDRELRLGGMDSEDVVSGLVPSAPTSTPSESGAIPRSELSSVCADENRPGCYLSSDERLELHARINARIADVIRTFGTAISEERIAARLHPKVELWMMLLDVVFGLVHLKAYGVDKLLARRWERSATAMADVVKLASRPSKTAAKSSAKKAGRDGGRIGLLDALDNQLSIEGDQIVAAVASKLDDVQCQALAAYLAPQHHTVGHYRAQILQILRTYEEDVEIVSQRNARAVAIEATHGGRPRRLAICTVFLNLNPLVPSPDGAPLGISYRFDHWVRDGFETMSAKAQAAVDANEYVLSPPKLDRKDDYAGIAGIEILEADSEDLVDPKGLVGDWNQALGA